MKPYHFLTLIGLCFCQLALAAGPTSVVDSLTFNGQADPNQASFVLKGTLKGTSPDEQEPRLIYSVQSQGKIEILPKAITQNVELKARVFQGKLKEMVLAMHGQGEVTQVTGPDLKDWSVRVGAENKRFLVIRPKDQPTNAPPLTNFLVTVRTSQKWEKLPVTASPLTFTPENSAFFDGFVELQPAETVECAVTNLIGLAPLRADPLPLSTTVPPAKDQPLRFRFAGADYSLAMELKEKDPDARKVIWENFKLVGELKDQFASFVLTGTAVVRHPDGGLLPVLSGDAALTSFPIDTAKPEKAQAELKYVQGSYWLRFPGPGSYSFEMRFNAKVTPRDGWNGLGFDVVPSALCPLVLKGLSADTQFQFPGAAKPERKDDTFVSYLPSNGKLQLQWKEAKTEQLGKLFYSAEGLIQIAVGPGLLRQAHLLEFKVMQGELNQLDFELVGEGEVTRIRGEDILSWKTTGTGAKRNLVINFSRPCRSPILIQTQTPLGGFPLQVQPLRLAPTNAIRYGGHLVALNDGAVRLEVTESRALSQISPELVPQSKDLVELAPAQKTQAFAYRFSGGDYGLALQAEHILPELSVSQVLIYHVGETESRIDAELELDIREAPLREFFLRIPSDFSVAKLNASEYSVTPDAEKGWSRLKMLFPNPLTGRQVVQLRLEKNQNATAGPWVLPVIQPQNVKSVRGYVGVSAETGFRITAGTLNGLTDIASAYFPKKVVGLQAAYRLREEAWQARMNIERLALSVQTDATHLFTVSEGIAYGSSVINYFISGTPISILKVHVPAEYGNVEFAGRDLRNWKKIEAGAYEVYLHTPVFGAYTLLATYDRQFSAQSNVVSFEGVRPEDAQSEQGSVLVVSENQMDVKAAQVSPGLLQLDPGEIPPEHRLLFDSPILAAYQYSARPFTLQLALRSLTLGETVHQVVDRAALKTRISREGEVVTTAIYFLKSQGHTHLRLTLTNDTLWDVRVNGAKVVPVADRNQTLIPLPAKVDPGAVLNVELNLAGKSARKDRVKLAAPILGAPVMLTEWSLVPDEKYHLNFRGGNIGPAARANNSGFAWIWLAATQPLRDEWQLTLAAAPILILLGLVLLRWGTKEGTYRWSMNHVVGSGFGMIACAAGLACLVAMLVNAAEHPIPTDPGLSFVAPIQNVGGALVLQVGNTEIGKLGFPLWSAWPALLAVALWIYMPARFNEGAWRKAGMLLGWIFLCWAALRVPNGAPAFFAIVLVYLLLNVLIPVFRVQLRLPRQVRPAPDTAAAAATSLLVLGLCASLLAPSASAAPQDGPIKSSVQNVIQQARVQEGFVYVKAQLQWKTIAGQHLDFLNAPAVLSKIEYPQSALQLKAAQAGTQSGYRLTAKEAGQFDISFEYQLAIPKETTANNFTLPTPSALVNRLDLEIEKAEVDVSSPQAVSVQTTRAKRQEVEVTRAELVLAPVANANIVWKPRSRDTRTEKAVFHAELWHLFIPTPGVVEGVHEVQVRPAQGQLSEVTFQIPPGLTMTEVQADFVSSWRFDADQRTVRVQFNAPQSRPFTLRLRSQLATSPLPYVATNGVITLNLASIQVGMIAAATGSEVNLDKIDKTGLSDINLTDFPAALLAEHAKQIPGLALRGAFRYSEASSKLVVTASAVQPDVRVQSQETLSLGEDRTVLASQLGVTINRAGVFKLSFFLPRDFEVESLTGGALSHWTELKNANDRIITMHLKGKTEGAQNFSINLAGPGTANRKQWQAPRVSLREANKQTGQLLVVPEVGMRLHVTTRTNITQINPQELRVRQKGVMAYSLHDHNWQFGFDVETVDPWVQVASLQDVTIREGQVLVTGQFDYQIENAGIKSLIIQLPPGATNNVRFEGELISDTVRSDSGTNRLADWEIKLQRRVIGNHSLRVTYQLPLTNQPGGFRIVGIKAKNANLQRGYLAIRSSGRLQIQSTQLPAGLQRTEWQSIPAALRRGRDLAESKDTFSTVECDFELPLTLSRHELAKVLPARVERVDLTSVVAPSGEMLTEGRLLLWPGDKRLLGLQLPPGSVFWYAFVNGQSAWPWRETEHTLLLLEKNSDPGKPTMVEFFYTCPAAERASGFSHQFLGPKFDLPLENITWRVFVPEHWQVRDWESSLQLRSEAFAALPASLSLQSYLQTEAARQQAKAKEAEGLLNMGNDFLQRGVPQQARRAYQSAWKLSPQDAAFNEDARVQLHNLKMQQALLGLNQRRQAAFDYAEKKDGKAPPKNAFNKWVPGQSPDYTQQQAEQILEQNPAEDNATLFRLAERLIRQQDAGLGKPQSIRATLPAQGKQLVFTGSLQVKDWADLRIKLDAKTKPPAQWVQRIGILAIIFACLALLAVLVRKPATVKNNM